MKSTSILKLFSVSHILMNKQIFHKALRLRIEDGIPTILIVYVYKFLYIFYFFVIT